MNIPSLTIAALFLAGTAAQAQGTSAHLGGKATLAANPVVQAAIESGIDVVMNDPETCADKNLDGSFVTYHNAAPDFVICVNNHATHAELSDTIRHEAHHAIVWCNRGKTFFTWDRNVALASVGDIGIVVKHYDAHEHNEELEARNVAKIISDEAVANKLRQFCM